jgi:hypothetical protein
MTAVAATLLAIVLAAPAAAETDGLAAVEAVAAEVPVSAPETTAPPTEIAAVEDVASEEAPVAPVEEAPAVPAEAASVAEAVPLNPVPVSEPDAASVPEPTGVAASDRGRALPSTDAIGASVGERVSGLTERTAEVAETGREVVRAPVAVIEEAAQTPPLAAILDFIASSVTESALPAIGGLLPPVTPPAGMDPPASPAGGPTSNPAPMPSLSGSVAGVALATETQAAAPLGLAEYLRAVGGAAPPRAAVAQSTAAAAASPLWDRYATAADLGPSASGHPSPSPADSPMQPSDSPAIGAGSGGSLFVPLAALLALLALAAPATFRRRMEVPELPAPTPFVCALERPG